MQNDLISRNAVIELIQSKCTDGCLGTEDTTLIDAYGLIDDISDIPTAYDVEKVEEQCGSYLKKIVGENSRFYKTILEYFRKGGVG